MKLSYLLYKALYLISGRNYKVMISYFRRGGVNFADSARCASDIVTPEAYLITIGEGTTISYDVTLITHDNSAEKCRVHVSDLFGRITIGKNCFIGARSVVLPGVKLGDNTIVAAGSVVTKSFAGNCVIGGNPAHVISDIDRYREKVRKVGFSINGLSAQEKKRKLLTSKLIEK